MIDLTKLKKDVDEIVEFAKEDSFTIGGAVNWARVYCPKVERCESETGEVVYRISIYKADASAGELQGFIFTNLQKRGYINNHDDIEITSEW